MKKTMKCITAVFCALCLTACSVPPSVSIPLEASSSATTAPTKPTTRPSTPATMPTVTEPAPIEAPDKWVVFEDRTYYYIEGLPHTGWLELDGDRYYFREDGTMARGSVKLSDTETRYFTSSGKEILLVNPWNQVPQDYSVTTQSYKGWAVATACYEPLERMLSDCAQAGHTALVVSGYRPHQFQADLYEYRVQRFMKEQGLSRAEAEIEAAKRVAPPGTSEHELGLAADIVDEDYQKLTEQQETMPAQIWLMENSWRYGFILRYPNGTTDSTGIVYEPWHYRYVGQELAAELHRLGLCLEDYLAALTENEFHP